MNWKLFPGQGMAGDVYYNANGDVIKWAKKFLGEVLSYCGVATAQEP
jgi:hypothetical protein